jgi:hypothetical protein
LEEVPEIAAELIVPNMADPPIHSVIILDEEVIFGQMSLHVSTRDCAPQKPSVWVRVFNGVELVAETEFSYADLVANDGTIHDASLVPVRVETIHTDTKSRLAMGGVDALDWS